MEFTNFNNKLEHINSIVANMFITNISLSEMIVDKINLFIKYFTKSSIVVLLLGITLLLFKLFNNNYSNKEYLFNGVYAVDISRQGETERQGPQGGSEKGSNEQSGQEQRSGGGQKSGEGIGTLGGKPLYGPILPPVKVISSDPGSYPEDGDQCCCGGCCTCKYEKAYELEPITLSSTRDIYHDGIPSWSRSGGMVKKGSRLKADVPLAWGLYFQDGATPSFEGIVDLHNRIMFYLVVILFGVSWIMLSIMWNFNKSENKLVYRYLNHGTLIELIWTVGPALVLVAIAFPSFKLLYLMDEVIDPAMTVKVTGHQWYWEYEYADFLNEENETINFDSYMKDEASLEEGELRMLEVDNAVVLPIDTHIRFIITGADVLHDWAVPALALKVDAAPGRLNQASVIIERTGYFYGQCSEICGVLHSSMPIKIEAVEVEKFFSWLLEQ